MKHVPLRRIDATVLTLLFGLATVAPMPTFAMELVPNTVTAPPSNPPQGQGSVKRKKTKSSSGQKQQRSDREFSDGFWVAYNLIYKDHDYAAGIAKLHSLGHDDDAAIANLIGYSSRKLGRYDDAKVWYENLWPPTRISRAPGPTTACGMPSKATCSRRKTSSRRCARSAALNARNTPSSRARSKATAFTDAASASPPAATPDTLIDALDREYQNCRR